MRIILTVGAPTQEDRHYTATVLRASEDARVHAAANGRAPESRAGALRERAMTVDERAEAPDERRRRCFQARASPRTTLSPHASTHVGRRAGRRLLRDAG